MPKRSAPTRLFSNAEANAEFARMNIWVYQQLRNRALNVERGLERDWKGLRMDTVPPAGQSDVDHVRLKVVNVKL